MTIRDDGHVKGSISGGCIEDDLIWQVQSGDYRETLPRSLKYSISADEAHRFGLPCGGTPQIVLESVTEKSQLQALAWIVLQQGLATRELLLDSGAVPLRLGADTLTLLFDGHSLLPPRTPSPIGYQRRCPTSDVVGAETHRHAIRGSFWRPRKRVIYGIV